MTISPFKFLDSYTKEDKNIFFGRDREIEELYHKVFESKILLVYGVSGTGKTSLINCGLASKLSESDWLPVNVRRGRDINESLRIAIQRSQQSAVDSRQSASSEASLQTDDCGLQTVPLKKSLKNLYLDHFKPVFLIFDQLEELFIFGSKAEKVEFIKAVKTVVESDLQVRFMFVIREEYLAGITEFERQIPTILSNRVRIEKMTHVNAQQAIEGPCKYAGIELEPGFSEALLDKLAPEGREIELTYLQVILDKTFRLAAEDKPASNPRFTLAHVHKAGEVKDLLGGFLEEQINQLENPDTALAILKSFVSIKGTKKQNNDDEVNELCKTIGKNIDYDTYKKQIQHFINIRILRDKDEAGRYELRHDALATKIYEKITLVEKELMEVKQFIENAYDNFQRRKVFLSASDLSYIAPYEDKMFLNNTLIDFIIQSKKYTQRAKRRRRNIAIAAVVFLLVVFTGFTIWALKERNRALEQEKIAIEQKKIAIEERNRTEKAIQTADSLKEIVRTKQKPMAVISATKMNILYIGVENPIDALVSSFRSDQISLSISGPGGTLKKITDGQYIAQVKKPGSTMINITVKDDNGEVRTMGSMGFRVKRVPDPVPTVAGLRGGTISKSTLLNQTKVDAEIFNFDFDLKFSIVEFSVSATIKGFETTVISNSALITQKQKELIQKVPPGQNVFFNDVLVKKPDGTIVNCGTIKLKVKD